MSNYSFTWEGYKWSMCRHSSVVAWVSMPLVWSDVIQLSRVSCIKVTQNPSNHTEGCYDPLLPVCRSSTLLLHVMLCCFAVCASSNVKFERTWFHTRNYICLTPSSVPVSMLKFVRVTCFCFALCCAFCESKVFGFRFDLSLPAFPGVPNTKRC